jgi:hypothetical protein
MVEGLASGDRTPGVDFWAKAALLKLSVNPRTSASRFMAL